MHQTSDPIQGPETPQDAKVLPLQEPRLHVASEGTQAILQLEGMPVSQVQTDSREAESHGGPGNRYSTCSGGASLNCANDTSFFKHSGVGKKNTSYTSITCLYSYSKRVYTCCSTAVDTPQVCLHHLCTNNKSN